MLRYRADVRTLGMLCTYAALCVGGFVVKPTGALAVAWVITTALVAWFCAVIAHNVVHSPVFTRRWMNKALQVWVSLSYGFPISDYIPGHNLSHHRFTQMAEDVMRTTKVRFKWNLLNLVFFMAAVTPAILRGNARYKQLKGKGSNWARQLMLEAIIVWSVKIGLTLLDWKSALMFVWVPHLAANWGIVTINFLQHDGCDEHHPVNHSRNFTGGMMNWLCFNNGYHGIHHIEPGLHWSLTPAAHAERVHPTLHPALEQQNLLSYAFKAFVWPARRVTFDGKPVVLPPPERDRDWVKPEDSRADDGAAVLPA
ncbi:MAG: fatty acid desaturase [Archangiaceae bacterium]|nr:fatty acid desaturase [Archangiaceae bacterium]